MSGAALAAAHGYFDQARFQRELLALTGLSPRERLLPTTERCRLVAKSALDLSWLDQVEGTRGVFVSAQGLFMYFDEAEVKRLLVAIVERFPGVELMFDTIPPWLSKKTLKGFYKTQYYRTPPMPWGIGRDDVEWLLRSWSPRVKSVQMASYGIFARGIAGALQQLTSRTPGLRNLVPAIAHVKTVERPSQPT